HRMHGSGDGQRFLKSKSIPATPRWRSFWRSSLVLVLSRGVTVLVLVIGTSHDDGTILRPRTT
ncbi:MAG: hypothetical protein ACKOAH_06210, partial [Pirellula sp.]